MAKKKVIDNDNMNRLNRISPITNFLFNALFLILPCAASCPSSLSLLSPLPITMLL